jgi:hypothetical protein
VEFCSIGKNADPKRRDVRTLARIIANAAKSLVVRESMVKYLRKSLEKGIV